MQKPKFSIGSWAFSFGPFEDNPWSFEKFITYAANAGYNGVEINGFEPHPHPDTYNTPQKCSELKHLITDHGLGISGYAPDFRHVPAAEVPMNDHIAVIEKTLAFCNNMNIDTLRVDTISPPDELSKEEYNVRFDRLAKTWHQAADVCKKAGVKLVWEFEPGFWLNKPSEVVDIVKAVNHDNFKVLFDTSHAYMCSVVGARQIGEKEVLAGGVAEFAKNLSGHIGHFHLIDSDGSLHGEETSTHAPFGTGNIDFVEVISSIKNEVEQLPWWCFDFCFCPTTEVDAKKAIPFVDHVISQIK
ncbi:MAG: sugar phosphate isomerase/epimerase [Flavobacteriales bacterium]|nr:sugar phosphate isomerase/epimerase [Flavobacteriales bacterium]